MVQSKGFLASLTSAALLVLAQASWLSEELSLGHGQRISPTLRAVPNFHLSGEPTPPDILSNKIVLTPPAPGNQRGSVWGEKTLQHEAWTADIDFRATGPERGGGNLQIWYAKDGESVVGRSSIYTVGKFDGMALVIDQYASSGGFVRGFLNDGTVDFNGHHSVDSLAFGHCEYSYRNLGRPSRIQIKQTGDNFRVEVDHRLCFESGKIKLPTGNNFGVTAASAENPDSFELFKIVIATESAQPESQQPVDQQEQQEQQQEQQQRTQTRGSRSAEDNTSPNSQSFSDMPDTSPSEIRSSDAQFADLHNRLQLLNKHISQLQREVGLSTQAARENTARLQEQLDRMEASLARLETPLSTLPQMERRLDTMVGDLKATKNDLHGALNRHMSGLTNTVRNTHNTILGSISEGGAPTIGMFAAVAVFSQGLTVVAYLLYKRRRNMMPKKYL